MWTFKPAFCVLGKQPSMHACMYVCARRRARAELCVVYVQYMLIKNTFSSFILRRSWCTSFILFFCFAPPKVSFDALRFRCWRRYINRSLVCEVRDWWFCAHIKLTASISLQLHCEYIFVKMNKWTTGITFISRCNIGEWTLYDDAWFFFVFSFHFEVNEKRNV